MMFFIYYPYFREINFVRLFSLKNFTAVHILYYPKVFVKVSVNTYLVTSFLQIFK